MNCRPFMTPSCQSHQGWSRITARNFDRNKLYCDITNHEQTLLTGDSNHRGRNRLTLPLETGPQRCRVHWTAAPDASGHTGVTISANMDRFATLVKPKGCTSYLREHFETPLLRLLSTPLTGEERVGHRAPSRVGHDVDFHVRTPGSRLASSSGNPPYAALPNACFKSSMRSSGCSSPIESRIRPSVIPTARRFSGSTPEWVVEAG